MTNRHRSLKNSIKLTGVIHYTVCHTKRDDLVEAALVQRFKMSKRYAPAQQNISAQHIKLMYTLVKLLWLVSHHSSQTSPEKRNITKAYERVQHTILAEDPVLSKLGVSLPIINTKTVCDFIRCQERLLNLQATKCHLPPYQRSHQYLQIAPCQPSVLLTT